MKSKPLPRLLLLLAPAALCYGLFIVSLRAQPQTPLAPWSQWVEFSSFEYKGTDAVYEQHPPSAEQYTNPILSGFYPDPSICRAGKEFFLINSSFSFFPGVPIFRSTDLVNWTQIGNILDRPSQLNLTGAPVSGGIFAPTISYHDGVFYMITTNVSDIGNFFVTSKNPAGPWSDPVPLPIDGIDPSIFFDDNGKTYIVHNGNPPDKKPLYSGHRSIWLWEFDPIAGTVANGRIIVNGGVDINTRPSWIEGPHIFKRNGWYYLTAAEGGTGPNHSQVIFRTKALDEPFVAFEQNPILTQRDLDPKRADPVTCLGHADFIQTESGEWWTVFLGVRPYKEGLSNIGRETFLLPVVWENDWPIILKHGTPLPRVSKRPNLPPAAKRTPTSGSFSISDHFCTNELSLSWLFLRVPQQKWWSLEAKPGSLLIAPRDVTLHSIARIDSILNGNPSFMAHRQQHTDFTASTTIVINSTTQDSEAGLAILQNGTNYFFIGTRIKQGAAQEVFLELHSKNSSAPELVGSAALASDAKQLELRIDGAGRHVSFLYRIGETGPWQVLAENQDGELLSTRAAGGFVGAVIGLYARLAR